MRCRHVSWSLGQKDATFHLTWHTGICCGKFGRSQKRPDWAARRPTPADTAEWSACREEFALWREKGAFLLPSDR